MYCVNCGIKLADSEDCCPLCDTGIGQIPERRPGIPLYPKDRPYRRKVNKSAVNGALLILWLIPVFLTVFVDLHHDWSLSWSLYTVGALVVAYVAMGLPMWFQKPNPVIFVPCTFAGVGLYLLLVERLTGGNWFLPFGLPVTGCFGLVVTALVVLLRYIKKGRLYIVGGGAMAFGAAAVITELLMIPAFHTPFAGWSVYPLIVLLLVGGMLIFLGINATARERMERRFFF